MATAQVIVLFEKTAENFFKQDVEGVGGISYYIEIGISRGRSNEDGSGLGSN